MARFNFCSGTYQSISPAINAEFAMNIYPEAAASPNARSAVALIGTDGLKVIGSLPAGSGESVPGGFTYKGRTFVVGVTLATQLMHLYEMQASGALTDRGPIGAPASTAPAIWAANPNQVCFTVAGTGFIYTLNLQTNKVNSVQPNGELAAAIAYCDTFFITFIQNTNTIMISAQEDGTTWPAINIGNVSEFPDNIVAMKVLERIIIFIGQKQMVPYYNSGALFPFVPLGGTLIEEGGAAPYGVEKLDNTLLWLGANPDEGQGMAWRLNGYTPQRISNHDVETIWQTYPTLTDVISSKFQSRGHKIWQLYFPTANATWRYDISTQMWHQAGTWNPQTGLWGAHKSLWHTFNFGKHICGDPFSGNIYQMDPSIWTDAGTPIRRVRRAPYIAKEHENDFHRRLEILAEMAQLSIQGPSEYPLTLCLQDSNKVLWNLSITDAGVIVPSLAPAASVPSTPILADNVNQSTFWQLKVNPAGTVYGSGMPYGRLDAAVLNMSTNGTFLDSGLVVSQTGIVSAVVPLPHMRGAQLQIRWSDDQGKTWSQYHNVSLGKIGDYRHRAILRRLGKSRNRIYEVVCDDPISPRIVDAYINGPKEAVERLGDQLRKMA